MLLHHGLYPLNPFLTVDGSPTDMDGEDVSPIDHGFVETGGSCPQWTRWEDELDDRITILTEADDGWMPESMDEGICYTVYLNQDDLGVGRVAQQFKIRQEAGHYLVVEVPHHGGSYFVTLYSDSGESVMSGGCWTEEQAWEWLRAEAARRGGEGR